MNEQLDGGAVEAIRDIVKAGQVGSVAPVTSPDGVAAVIHYGPDADVTVIDAESFDTWRTAPRFRKGIARFTKLDSLIAHINRFKDLEAVLFANDSADSPALTAVLDYHPAGAEAAPRFGHHRAHYAFPLSEEWQAWGKMDGQAMGMAEFAAFVEERLIDVMDAGPDADMPEALARFIKAAGGTGIATSAKLLEMSRGMAVHEKGVVKEARNLHSGEVEITFQAEHVGADGKPLKVPGLFLIAVPVFKSGALYRIGVRLRYRKTPSGLVFIYQMFRPELAFDDAFNEACAKVAEETALPLLFGQPE